jgi:hypothetical protein
MNGKWGANLVKIANNSTNPSYLNPITPPTIYFNDGSSDEMACVNGQLGSIGYSDADQITKIPGTYANMTALAYDGAMPDRVNIRNGVYNNFYANQWLYHKNGHPWINDLCNYANQPANIPSSMANYWATSCEMVFNKAKDTDWPQYIGATCPQTP